jgi:hypothetical protein
MRVSELAWDASVMVAGRCVAAKAVRYKATFEAPATELHRYRAQKAQELEQGPRASRCGGTLQVLSKWALVTDWLLK